MVWAQIHPKRLVEDLKEVTEFIFYDNPRIWLFGILIFFGMILAQYVVPKFILWVGLPKKSQAHFRLMKGKTKSGEDAKFQERRSQSSVVWERVDKHIDDFIGVLIHNDGGFATINNKKTNGAAVNNTKADGGGATNKKTDEAIDSQDLFYSTRASVVHFVALTVRMIIIVFGFYCVFFVAGVSFYSLAISWGVIGLVLTYAFGSIFGNLMGSFTIHSSGLCSEGMEIRIGDAQGKVIAIGTTHTTVSNIDPVSKEPYIAHIPNSYFNTLVMFRFPVRELPPEHKDDFVPTQITTKTKLVNRKRMV